MSNVYKAFLEATDSASRAAAIQWLLDPTDAAEIALESALIAAGHQRPNEAIALIDTDFNDSRVVIIAFDSGRTLRIPTVQ